MARFNWERRTYDPPVVEDDPVPSKNHFSITGALVVALVVVTAPFNPIAWGMIAFWAFYLVVLGPLFILVHATNAELRKRDCETWVGVLREPWRTLRASLFRDDDGAVTT